MLLLTLITSWMWQFVPVMYRKYLLKYNLMYLLFYLHMSVCVTLQIDYISWYIVFTSTTFI